MSPSLGSENLSGSDSTRAARQSFGKPKPIVDPSFEKARKTIRPTRNLSRPRTNASLLRGSVCASSCTSPTVTGMSEQYAARCVGKAGVRPRPGSDPGLSPAALAAAGDGQLVLGVLDALLELPAIRARLAAVHTLELGLRRLELLSRAGV